MADAPEYEPLFSYRAHFAREKKIPGWGSVVFGEEYPLTAIDFKGAEEEFKIWAENALKDPLISNPRLMEIRFIKPTA